MAKYTTEFKLQVVKEYLDETLGYKSLAKKHRIPSASPIKLWVRAYRAFGMEGLERKQTKTSYSVQFKVDVLHFIKQTGSSYLETAIKFGVTTPSLIASWNTAFQRDGIEGLKPKPKGRPSMSKKPTNQHKNQNQTPQRSREELEREIELLKLENMYLKKLEAFQKNPDVFLEKHKQRWHSNSKKKDSE
jgi:transposase